MRTADACKRKSPGINRAKFLAARRLAEGSTDPDGIRTRVAALKGPCPRPLDDGAGEWCASAQRVARRTQTKNLPNPRRANDTPGGRGSSIRHAAAVTSEA